MQIASAQNSPYQLHKGREITLLSGGTLLTAGGIVLQSRVEAPDAAEVAALNLDNVPAFDQIIPSSVENNPRALSHLSVGLAGLGTASLLLDQKVRSDFKTILVMGLEGVLLTEGAAFTTKALVQRPRPSVYLLQDKQVTWEPDDLFSFFSQHTATTSFLSFFSAKVFSDYHPHTKWKFVAFGGATVLTSLTGYFRVKGAEHFPSDVIVGGLVGGFIGWGIPQLHKAKSFESSGISFSPAFGPNTLGITCTF